MDRAGSAALSPSAAVGLRSFFVRLALVVATLGVPILGTSYFFVSQVSSDITMATTEHTSLQAYGSIADLFPALETLHRSIGASAVVERRASDSVDDAVTIAAAAYSSRPLPAEARTHWNRWRATWSAVRKTPTFARIDDLVDGLRDLGGELEYDAPLDYDPDYAIQNLAASILRQEPRSIAAIRQTIDALVAVRGPRLDQHQIVSIATGRALEVQPLALGTNDVGIAMALEPSLVPSLQPLLLESGRRTALYRERVGDVLTTLRVGRRVAASVETRGRAALDAHERLWMRSRTDADGLVLRRLDKAVDRRRVMITVSLFAVLLGTVGIVLIGRNMAHRDRVEVASAKLEGEKLRAELSQVVTERALRLQEVQFKTVFENTDLGIVIFDERGTTVQCNAAAKRIFDTTPDAVLGDYRSAIAQFSLPDHAAFTVETHCAASDGTPRWFALTFSGAYFEGACRMVILLMRDTTEEKMLQQQLLHDANHDSLTHIANRAAFENALRAQLERGRLGEPFALMVIDLDAFKPINDASGHAAGDRVLIVTAERLVAAVASQDFCARMGGDEFAILLRDTADRSQLASIARRVGAKLANPISFGNALLHVTASIGIAIGSAEYASSHEIELDADLALYAVKEHGRNGQRIYERYVAAPAVG